MPGLNSENLIRLVSKPVKFLSRRSVEEDAESTILASAKSGKVGLLVAGDPMVATTHVDLRLRAEKNGIRTRIIHAASIASAVAGVTGLQSYKFGRTVTIPATQADGLPESVYAALKGNFEAGMHSLILLEIDVESGQHVTIPGAIKRLLDSSGRTKDRLIAPDSLLVGLARLAGPDMVVRASNASNLMRMNFGQPPYCIVFPSRLHFVEAEALEVFCEAPKGLVGLTK